MTQQLLPRPLRRVALLLLLLLGLPQPHAAEALTYRVTVAATGDADIDAALQTASSLVTLQAGGAVAPLALLARARADQDRLGQALRSLGHYASQIDIAVAGQTLTAPDLPDRLEGLTTADVTVTVTPGPLFHLRHVILDGDAAGQVPDLAAGAPARAADVLAAGQRLQQSLREAGHAFARVDPPIADLVADAPLLDVTFHASAGPRVTIGPISVTGTDRLRPDYVLRRLTLRPGDPFDPRTLAAARADLARVPAIASVRLLPAETATVGGQLPITAAIVERRPHSISLSAAFSTDQGGNLSATWLHRDLFGGAESLSLFAAVTELGAGAAQQPGYRAGAAFTVPDWLARGQSLTATVTALRESLDAYDRTASIAGLSFARLLAPQTTGTAGLTLARALITQDGVARNYALLQTPLALRFDSTDSPIDPTSGWRGEAVVTPAVSLSRSNSTFLLSQLDGSLYLALASPGRTVLALRGLIGSLLGATSADIPPDQRFYAGGSGTVRGFRFESVGPKLGNARPAGASALTAGTVELRQRFGATWGAAVFLDGAAIAGPPRLGVGAGVRYYTGLGPIRLDLATPLRRRRGEDIGEVYIGLGQAF